MAVIQLDICLTPNMLKYKLLNLFFIFLYFSNIYAGNVAEQMQFAKKAYATNQYQKAISHLDIVLKEKSNHLEAYALRGKCQIELDNYNLALDDFNKAVNINPQEAEYLYYKGMCEWRLKRVSACIQDLEKSLVYDPSNFLANKILGSVYFEIDMLNMAKECFDDALDIQSDFSVNYFNKDKIGGYTDHYKIALRAANRDAINHPNDFKPIFYKGILKALAGDNWGAYIEFDQCVKKEPNVPLLYFYKAYVEYNIKKFDLALADLNKYAKRYPEDESVNGLIDIIKEITNIKIVMEDEETQEVLTFAEQMPEFNGGQSAMFEYLAKNIRYPKLAQTENIEGRVVIQFVVDNKGYVGNIEVMKAIGGGCEEEAIRVVANMPKWKPGKQNGKPVSVKYTLPISFKLAN